MAPLSNELSRTSTASMTPDGESGLEDVCLSVPARRAQRGSGTARKIFPLDEQAAFEEKQTAANSFLPDE